jgi:hypothetical protein
LRREGGSFRGSQNEAVQTKQAGKVKRAGENSPNTDENGIAGVEIWLIGALNEPEREITQDK